MQQVSQASDDRAYIYSHFTDVEIEAQQFCDFWDLTSRAWLWSQNS